MIIMPIPFISRQPTLEEAQEKNAKLDVELSIAEKQAAIAKLKEAGLTPKSFGGNWRAILNWLRK